MFSIHASVTISLPSHHINVTTRNAMGSSSPFLKLPREIRVQILRLLLHHPTTIQSEGLDHGLHPQTLQVNQQLSAEGLDLLYEDRFGMDIYPDLEEIKSPDAATS